MTDPMRIVIVDDHPGVRNGIKTLLGHEETIDIVGEGADGLEAIQLATSLDPDIMLLDVELPLLRGDEVVRRIHTTKPDLKILAVSSYDDRSYIQGMLESGAKGYITKDEAAKYLLEAILRICQDEGIWISPKASRRLIEDPPGD
jgi:DNA-binding NarL/FixJ family response regulator